MDWPTTRSSADCVHVGMGYVSNNKKGRKLDYSTQTNNIYTCTIIHVFSQGQ